MLAKLNFFVPGAQAPIVDISGPGRTNFKIIAHDVDLSDADALEPPPTLSSHGFCAVPFSATLPKQRIDEHYRRQFSQLCAEALKTAIGAPLAVGLSGNVAIRRGDGRDEQAPIAFAHTDFTPGSTIRKAAKILESLGHRKPIARFAAFNVWWLARAGEQDRPLALCDATSVTAADVQAGGAKVLNADGSPMDFGEVALVRYSPRQRWYWYPRLGPDRLLVFCGFDSDPSIPGMVMHSAFTNPTCPADAPPRISVECRCFAFW
jgi:hypothetical protein